MSATERTILLVEDNPYDEELTLRALRKSNILNPVVVAREGALPHVFLAQQRTAEGMPVVGETLWAIADVARFLSVTAKTAYRSAGRIPAFKVGWVWRFREAEIRNWLEEHRQPDVAGAKKEAKRSRRRRGK